MRELRRAAEKEALEAAAKQQLMVILFNPVYRLPLSSISIHQPGSFPTDGRDAGKWINDLTQYGAISLSHTLHLWVADTSSIPVAAPTSLHVSSPPTNFPQIKSTNFSNPVAFTMNSSMLFAIESLREMSSILDLGLKSNPYTTLPPPPSMSPESPSIALVQSFSMLSKKPWRSAEGWQKTFPSWTSAGRKIPLTRPLRSTLGITTPRR